ncbi:nuclear transport factor 2 family protein [Agrococcus citreus]|uniref:SnoaL-like domain-containing protein n=1 Tax=Agrococcus citreus TaxID=84643 RepID=A0ABN1YSV7_9MICO
MTPAQRWLDGYIRAWESKDAADVRAIFTDDAEYWFRPNDPEPTRGIDAIVAMWSEDDEPTLPEHDLRVLIEDAELGIIKGTIAYPGHESYTNLWEVHLAPDGRAHRFVEWYMTPREPEEG